MAGVWSEGGMSMAERIPLYRVADRQHVTLPAPRGDEEIGKHDGGNSERPDAESGGGRGSSVPTGDEPQDGNNAV